jgi:hypothetical protein
MQPRNLLLAAAPAVLLEPDVDDGDGEVAEAQPAASTVAPATTTVMIDFLNSYLLDEGSARCRNDRRLFERRPNRPGQLSPPNGISRRVNPAG